MGQDIQLREFSEVDWDAYCGCETVDPKIADFKVDEDEGQLILDGKVVQVIVEDECWVAFYGSIREALLMVTVYMTPWHSREWLIDNGFARLS